MAIAAALIVAAISLDNVIQPPIWLMLIAWTCVTVGAVIMGLRSYKAFWVYVSFERSAEGDQSKADAS
jgi:uncharacterized protein (DUF983 family)